MLLLFCCHSLNYVGPYLISGDEAIAIFIQLPELFSLQGLPFAFADPAVMIGIHVSDNHIDHVLQAEVTLCWRSSSSRGWLLCLCKKETPENRVFRQTRTRIVEK